MQIKFRLRDPETKKVIGYEWVEDNEWFCLEPFQETLTTKTNLKRPGVFYKHPAIREQWTGLTDKNGEEIYEGDRIRNYHRIRGELRSGSEWTVKFGDHETSSDYYAAGAYGWYAETDKGEEHTLSYIPEFIEVIEEPV